MKTYLVFAGWNEERSGGWKDFHESFDTLEEATTYATNFIDRNEESWAQVINLRNSKMVEFPE